MKKKDERLIQVIFGCVFLIVSLASVVYFAFVKSSANATLLTGFALFAVVGAALLLDKWPSPK